MSAHSVASAAAAPSFLAATLADTLWDAVPESRVRVFRHGKGVLELQPARPQADVVLSAGVHGDETAPLEVLDGLIRDVVCGALPLAVRLLVVFGNPAAMRTFCRYVDDDLNRLFAGRHQGRTDSREAVRANEIETAIGAFYGAASAGGALPRVHLDLHTAIRGSRFERFGLLPFQAPRPYAPGLLAWLAGAGLEALLINRAPAGTLAFHTAATHGAASCTLELGQVRPFGHNDLSRFVAIDAALRALVSGAAPPAGGGLPRVFRIAGELQKSTEAFALQLPDNVENFAPFPKGTVIATDRDYVYAVRHDEERIVFPNPDVKPGLRAGLMVVEVPATVLFPPLA